MGRDLIIADRLSECNPVRLAMLPPVIVVCHDCGEKVALCPVSAADVKADPTTEVLCCQCADNYTIMAKEFRDIPPLELPPSDSN